MYKSLKLIFELNEQIYTFLNQLFQSTLTCYTSLQNTSMKRRVKKKNCNSSKVSFIESIECQKLCGINFILFQEHFQNEDQAIHPYRYLSQLVKYEMNMLSCEQFPQVIDRMKNFQSIRNNNIFKRTNGRWEMTSHQTQISVDNDNKSQVRLSSVL